MTIRYKATRSDVWSAYWYTWRHSVRLNVVRLLLFGWAFFMAHGWLTGTTVEPALRVPFALGIALSVMVLLAIYPLLRFKKDERTLTISPAGLATTIGTKSGDVPWNKVARVAVAGDCIYIVGKNGNSFTVPRHAFDGDAQRTEFLERCTGWWKGAQAKPS